MSQENYMNNKTKKSNLSLELSSSIQTCLCELMWHGSMKKNVKSIINYTTRPRHIIKRT